MTSKDWTWVAISCLLVIVAYQVGKYRGKNSGEVLVLKQELAFQEDKEATRKAEFAQLLIIREKEKREAERRREKEKIEERTKELNKEIEESQERQYQNEMDMLMALMNTQRNEREIMSGPQPSTELMLDYLLSRNSNNLSSSIERYPVSSSTTTSPTVSPPTTMLPQKGLVTDITYSKDKPAALINDKIVHEGDIIDGVTVVKIHDDRVIFEKEYNGAILSWSQKKGEPPDSAWIQ